ncbi:MAG: extracellular solute-binding protein, partial [Pedobacter sp.]
GIAFMNGEAAMMINWFGFAAMCEVDANSKVKGKIYVDVLPSAADQISASLNVYWLYTIGKGSKHKEIAYDFIRFVTNQENDKLLTLEGGIGCRISSWNDAEINRTIPYYHKLETLHTVAKMLPQKKNWAQIATVIDEMVLAAVNTIEPTEKLVQAAQQKINELEK